MTSTKKFTKNAIQQQQANRLRPKSSHYPCDYEPGASWQRFQAVIIGLVIVSIVGLFVVGAITLLTYIG